jgi:hypothetical protein
MKSVLIELCSVLSLSVVCFGMWVLKQNAAISYAYYFEGSSLAPVSTGFFNSGCLFLLLPLPFVGWMLYEKVHRGKASIDPLVFSSVAYLALVFVLMFSLVALVLPFANSVVKLRP